MSNPGDTTPPASDGAEGIDPGIQDEELVQALRSAVKAVWWLILLRGVFAIVFGILALVAPAAALLGIVFVFAAFAILDGLFMIVQGVQLRSERGWGWLVAQGVVSLLAGIAAAVFPVTAGTVGALFVLWTIAFYSIVNGVAGIPAAAAAAGGGRKALAFVVAITSILLGVLLSILIFVQPVIETVLSLIWVVGIWAIVAGLLLVALAIQARLAVKQPLD